MIKNIKNRLQDNKHKTVLSNMLSLIILQGSNYILPLILLPYLVRVLGVEYFGLLAFATATISFFRGIVSYGFDLSGTQQISIYRDDNKKLTEILSAILAVKFILAILSLFILSILLLFFDKFNMHWEVFLFTFFIVFGDVLFPIWFFQGVEKMKMITYIRLSYKGLFVLSVIFFVLDASEYMLVPLLDSIGAILAGIVALYFVSKDFKVSFVMPKYSDVLFQFINGWHIFVSRIAVILYTSVNTFLLGILTNNESVGYYSIAEKIYMAIRGLFGPIIQALFPFLTKKYTENKLTYYHLVRKLSVGYFIALLLFSSLTFIFSSNLINIVAGKMVIESVEVLRILSFAIIFAIGSFYSTLLVIKEEGKILSKITLISMFINLILVFPLIYWFGIYGLAWQFVIIQALQSMMQIKSNFEIWRIQ